MNAANVNDTTRDPQEKRLTQADSALTDLPARIGRYRIEKLLGKGAPRLIPSSHKARTRDAAKSIVNLTHPPETGPARFLARR